MARRNRKGRPVSGVLLLDKSAGISSNKALQQVRHLYRAAKAGHTGSLDPLATGMLPLCFGEATKISAFLLDADKRYLLRCTMGVGTDTGDADGNVIERRDCSALDAGMIERVLPRFTGVIEQVPPMYSALKHEGRRLYELAREGLEVERKPREVTIHQLLLLGYEHGELELEVACSKGTYVRTLVEDIAAALDTVAHVTALRRLSVGPYEGEMHTMGQLEKTAEQGLEALDALLLPIDSGVAHWPDVHLGADAAFYMSQGQPVLVPHAPTDGWVRIYDQHRFLGLGEIQDDGRVAPRRIIRTPG